MSSPKEGLACGPDGERSSDPLDAPAPDAGLRSVPAAPESAALLRPETGCRTRGPWDALESHLVGLLSEAGHGRPDLWPPSFSKGHRPMTATLNILFSTDT